MVTKKEDKYDKFHKYNHQIQYDEIKKGIYGFLSLLEEIDNTDELYYPTLRALFLNKKYVPKKELEEKAKKYFEKPSDLNPKKRMDNLMTDSFLKIKLSDIITNKTLEYLTDAKSDLLTAEDKILKQSSEKYFHVQSDFKISQIKAYIELKEMKYYLVNPEHKNIKESNFDFDTNFKLLFNPEVIDYNLTFGSSELTLLTHCYKKVESASDHLDFCLSTKPSNKELKKKQTYLLDVLENPLKIFFSDITKGYDSL
jgi:hypothetical protein